MRLAFTYLSIGLPSSKPCEQRNMRRFKTFAVRWVLTIAVLPPSHVFERKDCDMNSIPFRDSNTVSPHDTKKVEEKCTSGTFECIPFVFNTSFADEPQITFVFYPLVTSIK